MTAPSPLRHGAVVVGEDGGRPLEMRYLEQGDAGAEYTLLFLHGLFDHKGTWSRLMPLLDSHFRLVAPDLIGYGRSSKPALASLPPELRYTVDLQAGYLRRFVSQLGLDRIVLVGSSLGGGTALRLLCTEWPDGPEVRGLVLVAAAGYPQALPGYIQEMAGWLGTLLDNPVGRYLGFRLGLVQAAVRRTSRRVVFDPARMPPELVEESVAILRQPGTLRAYRLAARNLVPHDIQTFPERYRQIACPTLVVWGEEDCIVPPLFALRFEADIPRTKLHVFKECGHAPQLEYPEEMAVLLRDWARHNL
ncbi:MAG: alpha/beta hydrolase [Gemmatimonadota bacterium]